jgi:hypothetical protein
MALAQCLTWSGTNVALLLVHDATSKSAISTTVHKACSSDLPDAGNSHYPALISGSTGLSAEFALQDCEGEGDGGRLGVV